MLPDEEDPSWLHELTLKISPKLSDTKAQEFQATIMDATLTNKNITLIMHKFLHWLLMEECLPLVPGDANVCAAVRHIASFHADIIEGGTVDILDWLQANTKARRLAADRNQIDTSVKMKSAKMATAGWVALAVQDALPRVSMMVQCRGELFQQAYGGEVKASAVCAALAAGWATGGEAYLDGFRKSVRISEDCWVSYIDSSGKRAGELAAFERQAAKLIDLLKAV